MMCPGMLSESSWACRYSHGLKYGSSNGVLRMRCFRLCYLSSLNMRPLNEHVVEVVLR